MGKALGRSRLLRSCPAAHRFAQPRILQPPDPSRFSDRLSESKFRFDGEIRHSSVALQQSLSDPSQPIRHEPIHARFQSLE